jgi:hypothetical protein
MEAHIGYKMRLNVQTHNYNRNAFRNMGVNRYLHLPNILNDSILVEITSNPFDGPNSQQGAQDWKNTFFAAYDIPHAMVVEMSKPRSRTPIKSAD